MTEDTLTEDTQPVETGTAAQPDQSTETPSRKTKAEKKSAATVPTKVEEYDPFEKVGLTSGDLVGIEEGFVYSAISTRDYPGAAMDDMRLKLQSEGYTLAKGVTAPHNPRLEIWRRPQRIEDNEFRAKKFDLAQRRQYAELLQKHPEYEPERRFRDMILSYHGLLRGRRARLEDLKEAARTYPVGDHG